MTLFLSIKHDEKKKTNEFLGVEYNDWFSEHFPSI